jgi:DNA-directed RNA polymerase specialized sigma24 family protein
VQYRFFAGLTNTEVAELLGTSERSVRRTWTVARAWLRREMSDDLPMSA